MKGKPAPAGVGGKLKELRVASGLSVREIAEAVGLPRNTYFRYEQRYTRPALPDFLIDRLVPIFETRGIKADLIRALGEPQPVASAAEDAAAEAPARLDVSDRAKLHPLLGRWQSLRDQSARDELKDLLGPLLRKQIDALAPDVAPLISIDELAREGRLAMSEAIDRCRSHEIEQQLEQRFIQRVGWLYDERTSRGKGFWPPEMIVRQWHMRLSRLIEMHQRVAPPQYGQRPIPLFDSQHHTAQSVQLKLTQPKSWCRRPPGLLKVIRAYGLRMPSELSGGKYSPGELILIDGTVLEHDEDRMIDMNILVHEGTEHHSVITHSGQIVDFNGAELTLRRFTEALVPDLPEPYVCFATDKIAVHRILSVEDLV